MQIKGKQIKNGSVKQEKLNITTNSIISDGSVTTYKDLTQNRIIRLNQDGSLDSTFVIGTGFNDITFSIIQDLNSKYIIGGNFTMYNGLIQNYICRLNQDGSLNSI